MSHPMRRLSGIALRATRAALVYAVVAILLPPGAAAQAPVAQYETVRVRIIGSDSLFEGVVSFRPSAWDLRLRTGETRSFATGSIRSVELLTTRRRTGRGVVVGGIAGAVVGGLLWMTMSDDDNCKDEGIGVCELFLNPVSDHIGKWLAVYSTGTGVVVGAIIGSKSKEPRWIPAVAPIAVRDTRRHSGSALAVRWTF
jgi:hypothetical protein